MAVTGKWAEIRLRGRTTQPQGEAGASGDELRIEGYGPGGVVLILGCRGADREWITGRLRPLFERFGGRIAAAGAVAYLFNEVGELIFTPGSDRADLVGAALEAGAEDVVASEDGSLEVLTAPSEFAQVSAGLARVGFVPRAAASSTLRAWQHVVLGEAAARQLLGLLGELERVEQVGNVYTNAEISDAVLARLQA